MDTISINNHENKQNISQNESIKLFILIGAKRKEEKACLQRFINLCMKNGKKNNSYKFLFSTLKQLSLSQKFSNDESLKNPQKSILIDKAQSGFLVDAIDNVKPMIEVRKVRISGTTQLVPSIIPKKRQLGLAIRWIIQAAIARRKAKKNFTLDQCLFAEIMDASQGIGTVKKRRDDLHKLAETNRGFAHYRWW
jgi:small subunit ribosomal protein S7